MKIGEILPFFPPYPGGQEVHGFWISYHLSRLKGCRVEIFTSDFPRVTGNYSNLLGKGTIINRFRLLAQIYNNPLAPRFFFKLFKSDVDIIHIHGYWSFYTVLSSVIALIRKKPLVLTFHGYQDDLIRNYGLIGLIILKTYLLLTKWLYIKTFKAITCNHNEDKELLISMGFDSTRINIIPSGINIVNNRLSDSTLSKFREKYSLRGRRIVLYVGRLIKRKGAHNLIKIFQLVKSQINNALLLVVGTGELESGLKSEINKNGLENDVKMLGFVKPLSRDLDVIYSVADVLVLPSYSESMPRAIIECLLFNCPVVTSNRPFSYWLTEGKEKSALLADPDNFEEFAKKVVSLLNDRNLREEIGRNGNDLVKKNFNWLIVADKTLRLFRDVISKE